MQGEPFFEAKNGPPLHPVKKAIGKLCFIREGLSFRRRKGPFALSRRKPNGDKSLIIFYQQYAPD